MQNEPITEQERANNKVEQNMDVDELLSNREERRQLEITKRVRLAAALCPTCGKAFVGPVVWRCQCPVAKPKHLAGMETK